MVRNQIPPSSLLGPGMIGRHHKNSTSPLMKLPNASKAIVDIRKITDYCLNPNHLRGLNKARVFKSALGLTSANAVEIRNTFLAAVMTEECTIGLSDEYGTRYIVDFEYKRLEKKAMLSSVWIIKKDEDIPRLASCFVL